LFDGDLLLAFIFMAVLFLRQISILKEPNKINYAPLMIGVGAISSVVHFIIHPEAVDTLLILRESFFPFLVALFLYIVMNILHQTLETEHMKTQHEFTKTLIEQITQLKDFSSDLERRMILNQENDKKAQTEVQEKFKQDIKALDTIQVNQSKFLEKFEEMGNWHKDVSKAFVDFTEVQLPSLDNVVHKHIDILRVAEQDHYNQIKSTLKEAVDNKYDVSEDIDELKSKFEGVKNVATDIANSVVRHTIKQLSGVTKSFENQILSLKSHTEGIGTSLLESERRLDNIREKSEMIMKQMILSSKKMNELEGQNSGLNDLYFTIKELLNDIEVIKADYVKSQSQLSSVANELKLAQDTDIKGIKEQMETLIIDVSTKIEDSLDQLQKEHNIPDDKVSKNVQFLAKQVQLKKGYSELDN